MNLDTKELRYFVAVVREGNITKAAKKLIIAQPALSKYMKSLEESLDVKLFHRGAREITLTDSGEILYKKAITILNMKDSIIEDIADNKSGFKGTLKIGAISAIEATLLENIFLKFHNKYKDIKYVLHEEITPHVIDMLLKRDIEIGIVRTPFSDDNLDVRYLQVEPMIAAYKTDEHLDSFDTSISIADLHKKPLIIYRRFESILISAFQTHKVSPDIFCINDDSRTSLLWANAGLGVAIVPMSSKNLVLTTDLKYKIINDDLLYTQLGIITLKDTELSTVAVNFLKEFN